MNREKLASADMTVMYDRKTKCRFAAIVALVAGATALAGAANAEDYSKTFSVSTRPTVHIATNDGSVHVTSGDSAQVEISVSYDGYRLDKTLHIESSQHGDQIELTAHVQSLILSFGQTRRVQIEVRMPKDADLQVDTGYGSVTASSLSGAISLHTRDGTLTADHLSGTIDLRSGYGDVTVASIAGDIHLATGDGKISGDDLDGRCDANSHDGRIRLAGRFDVLLVKSGSGDVDARALPGSKLNSPWTIRAGYGSVNVALPGATAADVDLSSDYGRVRLDIPVAVDGIVDKSKVRGKINGGGQALTIHTGDGSIHLIQD